MSDFLDKPKKTNTNSKHYRIQKSAAEAESIDNVIILENNTEYVKNAMNRALAAAMEEIGLAGERFAKDKCPVDTGRLRNSITHVHDEGKVYLGTNVEYAPYIEFGTSRQDPRPFLTPAATQHTQFYKSILKKHLQNA